MRVKGIDLTGYDVAVSIRQRIGVTMNAHVVDIEGDQVALSLDGSDTLVTFTLTQEQSGGFIRGYVDLQVNYGSGSTRMATTITTDYMDENLKNGVMEFSVSTDPDTSVPEAVVEPVAETYVPAVTSAMIANGAVTLPKLADDVIESLPSPTDEQVSEALFGYMDEHGANVGYSVSDGDLSIVIT